MEIGSFDRYGHIQTALKEAGFEVVKNVKQGKKAIITVIRHLPSDKYQKASHHRKG